MLICVPAHEIESNHSRWLNSEPQINVAGKNEDGKSYEVVVHVSYVQWLFFLGFEQYLDYDPTAPAKEDILVHDTGEAIKRGRARFLRKAADRIRSGCCQGYEECYRHIALSHGLRIPLERALLIHDILVSSSPFDFEIPLTFFRNLTSLMVSWSALPEAVDAHRHILTRKASNWRRQPVTPPNVV